MAGSAQPTSRDRVLAALEHRPGDAVPLDFGSTPVTGMHVSVVAALRDHFGLVRRPVKVHEPYQMLGLIDDDLKAALGVDVDGVPGRATLFGFRNDGWKPWRTQDGLEVLVSDDFHTTVDGRGDTLIYPKGDREAPPAGRMPKGFHFFDVIIRQDPIDDEHLDPADNLEEYEPLTDSDLDDWETDVRAAATGERAVMAVLPGCALGDIALVPGPGLTHPKGIRDITEWYISIKKRPAYIEELFSRQVDIALDNLARLAGRVGALLDVVMVCGTDFGTQSGSFCSVDTFRRMWLPHYRRINDWIHAHTGWKTFKHSCGSVERFVPSFVEAGFDILNPVQCSAADMAPEHLKSAYGGEITFWGGGVDTQKTLPFGTPAEVRDEVLRRCEVFSSGGGFVFNSIHNVQARTPIANVVAMIDAVHEFNGRR